MGQLQGCSLWLRPEQCGLQAHHVTDTRTARVAFHYFCAQSIALHELNIPHCGLISGPADRCAEYIEIRVARRIYVGNLHPKTSWQDLKDYFRAAGNGARLSHRRCTAADGGTPLVEALPLPVYCYCTVNTCGKVCLGCVDYGCYLC